MLAIGIMSGTSLDGIDVCLVEILNKENDNYQYNIVGFNSYPYSDVLVDKIKKASKIDTSNVQMLCSLNVELSYAYVDAIKKFLKEHSICNKDIAYIAMHGQTVWHNPDNMDGYYSSTLQLGDPSVVSYAFNTKVISNFRMMDMAASGSGAPLIPFVNYILYKNENKSIAMQNIGGIGNVCYLDKKSNDIIAYDTGPGNMLIDSAMKQLYNLSFDSNGSIGKSGTIIKEVLNELLNDEYLKRSYPKSTGREKYNDEYLDNIIKKIRKYSLKNEDVIATITAYTAYSIIDSYHKFLGDIDEVIVSGGGSHNQMIMDILKKELDCEVTVLDNTDAYEAFGFAIIGHMTILNKPSNVPSVTGALRKVVLGNITNPPYEE